MISALLASCSSFAVGIRVPSAVRPWPDPVGEVVGVDGDDHRRRDTAGVRNVPGPQLPVAEIFQGVMAALPIGPAVDFSGGIDPGFRQRVEQRLEFRAGGPGEPEVPDIGPVPGRPQMKVAPIFVQLIVGHGAVGVDAVDDPVGEQLEVFGREHRSRFR